MKKEGLFQRIAFFLMLGVCTYAQEPLHGQSDALETLQWVERQSNRIDSMLVDAMRGSEPVEILVRLTDCYQIFDAVAMAGLYCTDVRASAEAGRMQCDVINYRLEKDLNAKLQRAVEARLMALMMKEGAKGCMSKLSSTADGFLPLDLLLQDAHMAELDILDGMATQDLHMLSQKLEHAIQTLHHVEHLARTLINCDKTLGLARSTIEDCQLALSAPNWLEAQRALETALESVQKIQQDSICY